MLRVRIATALGGDISEPFLLLPQGYECTEKRRSDRVVVEVRRSGFDRSMETYARAYSLPEGKAVRAGNGLVRRYRRLARNGKKKRI
jgi:hypothetical protein